MPDEKSNQNTSAAADFLLRMKSRLLHVCLIIGFVAGAGIIWIIGWRLWTVVVFLFLAACPLVVAWVLAIRTATKSDDEGKAMKDSTTTGAGGTASPRAGHLFAPRIGALLLPGSARPEGRNS
jgi:hypothetical protein